MISNSWALATKLPKLRDEDLWVLGDVFLRRPGHSFSLDISKRLL